MVDLRTSTVWMRLASTLAPAMTAPEASVTLPRISPKVDWDTAGTARVSRPKTKRQLRK